MIPAERSTRIRLRNVAVRGYYRYVGHVLPNLVGRSARDLWFAVPPRMGELSIPDSGERFEVAAQGHSVRGLTWGSSHAPVVYLVHGWGGRGSQLAAMVTPLVEAGRRVVLFDMPAHGSSDHGPAGPRRSHGAEFGKALDEVFVRFGPAEAVIAHSLGAISTYLALRYGWLGVERLVLVAPMVEAEPLMDTFQSSLGFGRRVRRVLDRLVGEFIGVTPQDFDARVQARHIDPVPTLVITDRDDRQAPYDGVVDFAAKVNALLVTTRGLGHRKILRDPEVVDRVVAFVSNAEAVHRMP